MGNWNLSNQDKQKIIVQCPTCNEKMHLPKIFKRLSVNCPKCSSSFSFKLSRWEFAIRNIIFFFSKLREWYFFMTGFFAKYNHNDYSSEVSTPLLLKMILTFSVLLVLSILLYVSGYTLLLLPFVMSILHSIFSDSIILDDVEVNFEDNFGYKTHPDFDNVTSFPTFFSGKLVYPQSSEKLYVIMIRGIFQVYSDTVMEFHTNIHYKEKLYFFKLKNIEGVWNCHFTSDTVINVKNVYQYYGSKRYFATEITFKNGNLNDFVVLAFDTMLEHKNFVVKIKKLIKAT